MRMITPLVRRALVAGPLASVLLAGGVAATSEPPTGPASAASDEFCAAAWQVRDASGAIDELAADADADPDAVREAYDQLATATADASAVAPPELVDGLDLLAGQAGVALAVVEANHFDLTAAEADPRWQALGEFDQLAELPALQAEVETYVDTYCGDPTTTSEGPDDAAVCDAAAAFETASDTFGAAIADDELSSEQLQQAFTDYFVEIDRLLASGPDELVDGLAEWRPIIEAYQDVFEANAWNVMDAMLDPALDEIGDDVANLESSPMSAVAIADCDEASGATDDATETTIG